MHLGRELSQPQAVWWVAWDIVDVGTKEQRDIIKIDCTELPGTAATKRSSLKEFIYLLWGRGWCMPWRVCGGLRTALWTWFFCPKWVLEIEFKSSGLRGKRFYPQSHLAHPQCFIFPKYMGVIHQILSCWCPARHIYSSHFRWVMWQLIVTISFWSIPLLYRKGKEDTKRWMCLRSKVVMRLGF